MKTLDLLEKNIGVKFKDQDLLKSAVIHRSYLNEHKGLGIDHNERLEFLGDAVLEFVVTEYLYEKYPNPEGDLTNWRSSLVNANMLSDLAETIDLYDFMHLSRGEAKDSNLKARRYILSNAFEALIGSIYLDQGLKVVGKFIKKTVLTQLQAILENQLHIDPKSRFQEKAQEVYGVTPHYKVLDESGPDHNKKFKVGLFIDKDLVASGTGFSKQEGQVKAAAEGLKEKGW